MNPCTLAGTRCGLSGDCDFQFVMAQRPVGAPFRLPCVPVLVNNSYLGLICQGPARLREGFLRPTRV